MRISVFAEEERGRRAELDQGEQLLSANPEWTRYRLSRELARLWDWYSASGQLKDMAARTLQLKLEERGLIRLPARRCASPNRMRHKQVPTFDSSFRQEAIHAPLSELLPLDLLETFVERDRYAGTCYY